MRFFLLIVCLVILIPLHAQDNSVIASTNIQNLQPIAQIDFEALETDFSVGQFVMSAEASVIATYDNLGTVHIFDGLGALQQTYPLNFPDVDNEIRGIALTDSGDVLGILVGNTYLHLIDLTTEATETYSIADDLGITGNIQTLWLDGVVWLEVFDFQSGATSILVQQTAFLSSEADVPLTRPYTPEQDFDAVVRIGRIPSPYVVTSSASGIVKLWQVETGAIIHEVDNGAGQPAVFGNINAAATDLVWRDNPNESLYVLNFEASNNRFVADLGGAYAQWLFLSNDASTILAVGYDGQPNVVAWDVETGAQFDLGDYRHCNRPQPDTAQLSQNGTTLVIGCDTGLEIWRIADAE